MSGGEPLSEELSPEVEAAIDEFSGRIFRWYSDSAAPALPGPGEILRAFAREILSNQGQRIEDAESDVYRLHADKMAQYDRASAAESALLASQESCRSLSDVGERHMVTHGCSVVDANGLTCRDCDELRAALAAYRSSEAGRADPPGGEP